MQSNITRIGLFPSQFLLLFLMTMSFFDCFPSSSSAIAVVALSENELCEHCQTVLYHAFQYYRVQTTKRLLRHKVKHLCKRYFEYRRHCLVTLLSKVELIWENMEKAMDDDRTPEPEFKPYSTCEMLKECDKDHSPLVTFEPENGKFATTQTTSSNPAGAVTTTASELALLTPDYIL